MKKASIAQQDVDKIKMLSAKDIRQSYHIRESTLDMIREARLQTQGKIKDSEAKSNIGGKLSKAGIALILSPDPFTTVPGVAIYAVGKMMSHHKSMGVSEVIQEAKSTLNLLREIRMNGLK